jgi:hypothetical protein
MADDLTNKTFPSDDIDDTNDDHSKGGKTSSSQQDMSEHGQMRGNASQQNGDGHQLTDEERSRGGSH